MIPLLCLLLVGAVTIAACAWLGLHRPFLPGNRPAYRPEAQPVHPGSPLRGKRILFLGSSVTQGMTARGDSFVDYLAREDGCLAREARVQQAAGELCAARPPCWPLPWPIGGPTPT